MSRVKARFKSTSAVSSKNRLIEYRPGQFVFRSGDLGSEMFVIHDGKAEVMREGAGGSESVATLEKGDFFGEMAVLEGLPRTASVRALNTLSLVRIDGTTFTKLLRSEPEIAVRIMRKLSRRLREATEGRGAGTPEDGAPEVGSEETERSVARLVHHESGSSFELPSVEEVLVGRADPITGIEPQVDLSTVDPERSCSRQHAKIVRDGSRYVLIEDIGTTNGTFINGERLETGVPEELAPRTRVRFGTVRLEFVV